MKRFLALYFTNLCGVINNNFLKTLASFLVVGWVATSLQSLCVGAIAGAFVLPYVLFSPLADRLTSRYSKVRIVRYAKWVEFPMAALTGLGLYFENIGLLLVGVLLLGTQSALFSPSKYSLIRDIGGSQHVSEGMGGMEAVAFAGMLTGMVAASLLASRPLLVGLALSLVLMVGGLLGSYRLRATEQPATHCYPVLPFAFFRQARSATAAYPGLPVILTSLSVFWWMCATMQMTLLLYCQQCLQMSSLTTGLVMSLAAVGITLGCLLSGHLGQHFPMLHRVPLTGLLLSLLFGLHFVLTPLYASGLAGQITLCVLLLITTVLAGFYKIPLDAEIQKTVSGPTLNLVLSYFNQLSFCYILLASFTFALLGWFLSVKWAFLMMALVLLIASVYLFLNHRYLICRFFWGLLRRRYQVEVLGIECLQTNQTLLLLPNHVAVIDPLLLFSYLYQYPLSPLVDEAYFRPRLFRRVLSLFHSIEVPDLSKSRQGLEQARQLHTLCINALSQGHNLLFYPSGHITRTGTEQIGSRHLAYSVCSQLPSNVRVVGVVHQGLWGSATSRYGRSSTPPLLATCLRSLFKYFGKRRRVELRFTDLTAQVRQWAATGDKMDFNRKLENFYNS